MIVLRLAGYAVAAVALVYTLMAMRRRNALRCRGASEPADLPLQSVAEIDAHCRERMERDALSSVSHRLTIAGLLVGIVSHVFSPLAAAGLPAGLHTLFHLLRRAGFLGGGAALVAGSAVPLIRRLAGREQRYTRRPGDVLPLLSLALVGASGIVCALVPPGSSRALTSAASLLHVLSMSFLLIMLPRSKLFHALGFGTLKRVGIPRRTGVLPKDSGVEHALSSEGAGDRRLGLSTLRDLSLRQRVEADACLSCGLCDVACPPARQGKALSPMRLTQAQAALMNTGSESAPLPSSIARASLDCSSCYACETSCPLQIRKVDRVAGLRRHSVLERGETLPEWSAMLRVCDRTGSVLGAVPGARASLLAALGVPVLEPGDRPEYVLWLGCYGAYDPRMKAVVSALSAALSAAGRRVAALRSESCCGDMPRRAGDEGLFHSLMERNQASLAALDGARVMTVCPHCAHVLGREYAAFGIHVDAVHYTQVLADLPPGTSVDCAQAGPGPRVAYHDSCVLARLYGVADEPRAFLRRTRPDAQIVPLDQERMNTVCCGGGGGRVMAEEPRSQRIAATTMRELSRKQVDVLVTSCPYCLTMYTDAAADAGVRVSDLLAFAAEKRLWPATVRQGS